MYKYIIITKELVPRRYEGRVPVTPSNLFLSAACRSVSFPSFLLTYTFPTTYNHARDGRKHPGLNCRPNTIHYRFLWILTVSAITSFSSLHWARIPPNSLMCWTFFACAAAAILTTLKWPKV
ncbi:hypothetical protein EDD21DRAFT_127745 [Dissophora ornata]|nr:hypothetical protein EDD21DRAFT_127745 [Dissophora ornata]